MKIKSFFVIFLVAILSFCLANCVDKEVPSPESSQLKNDKIAEKSATWTRIRTGVLDVGVAGTEAVWIVDFYKKVYVSFNNGTSWHGYNSAKPMDRIDVGGKGVWTIASDGTIYEFTGRVFEPRPGLAQDITVTDNAVLKVSKSAQANGEMYQWNASSQQWDLVLPRAGGKALTASNSGNKFIATNSSEIYGLYGHPSISSWLRLPGHASDISAGRGRDAALFKVSASRNGRGDVYRFSNGSNGSSGRWIKVNGGTGYRIDVNSNGTPYLITSSGELYYYN